MSDVGYVDKDQFDMLFLQKPFPAQQPVNIGLMVDDLYRTNMISTLSRYRVLYGTVDDSYPVELCDHDDLTEWAFGEVVEEYTPLAKETVQGPCWVAVVEV